MTEGLGSVRARGVVAVGLRRLCNPCWRAASASRSALTAVACHVLKPPPDVGKDKRGDVGRSDLTNWLNSRSSNAVQWFDGYCGPLSFSLPAEQPEGAAVA